MLLLIVGSNKPIPIYRSETRMHFQTFLSTPHKSALPHSPSEESGQSKDREGKIAREAKRLPYSGTETNRFNCKGFKALSVTFGDSSPGGRAKGHHEEKMNQFEYRTGNPPPHGERNTSF